MKIRTRLTLLSSLVFGIVFIVIAVVIFSLYYNNAKSLIYGNLKKTADISALFYLEEDELSHSEFEKIKIQFMEVVSDADYQVYDADGKLVYGEQDGVISAATMDRIRESGKYVFSSGDYFCYGIYYEDNQGNFVIIAKEKQSLLTDQTNMLLWILAICFLTGVIAIVLFSLWLSHIAYLPFQKIISQVNNISTNNLDVQIESPRTKDELQNLTDTFNRLLSKIAETVVIQRNFVNYVSHEFKTPLASLMGNLEVFSMKDRTPEEYRQLSGKLLHRVNQMEEILNVLMVVSDLKMESPGAAQTRLDEVIWEIIDKIGEHHQRADIRVKLNIQPEEENLLSVSTERTQLLMLLYNLLENAVKYSKGKPVEITVFSQNSRLCMSIADKGIGIMPEHLAHVSKPFYRADHSRQIEGSGIGLSIALRIMEKNRIAYHIASEVNVGTTVTLNW